MHHSRVRSMTSEDQDHDHDYSDESSNEASSPKRRKVSASWVNVSCQLCKTRKVKCDRTLPSCGWCTRNNAVCEYKERKKPGLRAGYGRELEQRLDRLEGVLLRHEEMLSRALEGMQESPNLPNYADERRWREPTTSHPSKAPYQFPHSSDNNAYSVVHARSDSRNDSYSTGQQQRDFPSPQPPIKTSSSHDRRPSVTFMNNPTSPPSHPTKLSASQSPPQITRGILKHGSPILQYPSLPTPDTTNTSSSHSPQHVQDYISHRPFEHSTLSSEISSAKQLRQRYPLHESCKTYTDGILPPWEVMYELSILYFANINSVLPLVSEPTVFNAILDPRRLKEEDTAVRAILMAITVVTVRFLPPGHLSATEQERYVTKCRVALASPAMSKSREGTQALAVLLLGSNGQMGKDETVTILGKVNDRLWQKGSGEETKTQSPLSVNEMLCRPSVL